MKLCQNMRELWETPNVCRSEVGLGVDGTLRSIRSILGQWITLNLLYLEATPSIGRTHSGLSR